MYARHHIDAVHVGLHRAYGLVIAEQRNGPARKQTLSAIRSVIEIGVVPNHAVDDAGAWYGTNVYRHGCLRPLQRVVPRHLRCVYDRRSVGEVWINDRPETQNNDLPGIQGSIHRAIVRRQDISCEAHAVRQAVHRRRLVDVGQVARVGFVEIVRNHRIERRNGANIADRYHVFEGCSCQGRTAVNNRYALADRQLLGIADYNDSRLGSR